jgi:hypothetical protein
MAWTTLSMLKQPSDASPHVRLHGWSDVLQDLSPQEDMGHESCMQALLQLHMHVSCHMLL